MSGFDLSISLERGDFSLDVQLTIPHGIGVVSGPSGSGKSSLLLAVLGALRPGTGRISAAGTTVFDSSTARNEPVHRRGIGMIFQHAALFPHMSVAQNVLFAAHGSDRPGTVDRMLALTGSSAWAHRMPAQLSGGQTQRVALARALAAQPRALLLDEPFSALDRAGRSELGRLLADLQRTAGVPFLYVTHDLAEALQIGDYLVLIEDGRVLRSGVPEQVLSEAGSAASDENLFRARVVAHHEDAGYSEIQLSGQSLFCARFDRPPGSEAVFSLRPQEPLISIERPGRTSARNCIEGTISSVTIGPRFVEVVVKTPFPLRVHVTRSAVDELGILPGMSVRLLIKASALRLLS